MRHSGDVIVGQIDPPQTSVVGKRLRWQLCDVVLLESPGNDTERREIKVHRSRGRGRQRVVNTHSSVVSSGIEVGTAVRDFSLQSTMPSAHRHGWGQEERAPHSIGAFSVSPAGRECQSGCEKFASMRSGRE